MPPKKAFLQEVGPILSSSLFFMLCLQRMPFIFIFIFFPLPFLSFHILPLLLLSISSYPFSSFPHSLPLLLHPFLTPPFTRFKWCWTWAQKGTSDWVSQSWWYSESFFLYIISFSPAQNRNFQILLDSPGTLTNREILELPFEKGKWQSWRCSGLTSLLEAQKLAHTFRKPQVVQNDWSQGWILETSGRWKYRSRQKAVCFGPWQAKELHWKAGGALKGEKWAS